MKKQLIFDFYNTLYNPKTKKLFRGVSSLLKSLKGKYQLSLVTTYSADRADQIKVFKLDTYFSNIVVCDKKTTKVFKTLTKNYSSNLIIGDREEEEISIGKKLNIKTLTVDPQKGNPVEQIGEKLI